MPKLLCGRIDLNDHNLVRDVIRVLRELAKKLNNSHRLHISRDGCHFELPDGPITDAPGWYVILEQHRGPIYVGRASNLNNRLNLGAGSLDNFANQYRRSDSLRNFIKVFSVLGVLDKMRVILFAEKDFCSALGVDPHEFAEHDRGNIEKLLNLFRYIIIDHPGAGWVAEQAGAQPE